MIPGSDEMSYQALLLHFLPRPIETEADYEATQREIDRLVDKGDLSPDEADYLHLLGTLVMVYEARTETEADYDLRGAALVRGLLSLHGLKQKDLVPIFKTKSIVSAVLNGKRPLTATHINRLAAFFHLPHSLFFERDSSSVVYRIQQGYTAVLHETNSLDIE
jgi:HTH-type transcriptional regulator/antitoxin HigA